MAVVVVALAGCVTVTPDSVKTMSGGYLCELLGPKYISTTHERQAIRDELQTRNLECGYGSGGQRIAVALRPGSEPDPPHSDPTPLAGNGASFVRNTRSAGPDEARTALVIGNAGYRSSPLANPRNDARDLAKVLEEVGFDVTVETDLDEDRMKLAIRRFSRELKDRGGVGFFYYAGHGVEVRGENFLIPVGADIPNEDYVDLEAVSLREITAGLSLARNRLNIVVLDACRNNPYTRTFRSAARGLKAVRPPAETLIAYSADSGQIASDGAGSRNSPYAAALMEEIVRPSTRLVDVFRNVKREVRDATNGAQNPWQADDLTLTDANAFYFVPTLESEAPEFSATPPRHPGQASEFSLGDLDTAAKAEEEARQGWAERLDTMEEAFAEVRSYSQRNISDALKTQAWSRFGEAYSEDDPYSSRDDQLRAQARQQMSALQTQEIGARGMVRVPAGEFFSGCNEKVDSECDEDEKPGKKRYVSAFAIDATEVTVEAYRECVERGACSSRGLEMPFYDGQEQPGGASSCNWNQLGLERHPLNCVDWSQATSFCSWKGKRLPTEWEWEKAARGTDGRKYPWGNGSYASQSQPVANIADETLKQSYADATIAEGYDDGVLATSRVGKFPAGSSPYGAQDMIGNVYDWTQSKSGSENRVVRGGSWGNGPRDARASLRLRFVPDDRNYFIGFRCAQ